jgi:CRISPR/Cas system-associated endoribonuclease Cas2
LQYVICYDIADDRRRNRIATALLDFGQRVQESVFVAHLDEELAARMKERVERLVDAFLRCARGARSGCGWWGRRNWSGRRNGT